MNIINETSLAYLITFFSIYSFLGWLTEVIYAYHKDHLFINRGFLYGPLCPIYGSGIIILILCLNNYKNNIGLIFLIGMLLTSSLEYLTGFVLEKAFNTKWWDYSDMSLNIHGRICISFSVIWGVASIFIVSLIHPLISELVSSIPILIIQIYALIFFIYFILDFIFTMLSLIKFNKFILQILKSKEELINKVANFHQNFNEENTLQVDNLRIKYHDLISRLHSNHIRLLKAFPTIKSNKDIFILKEMKDVLLKYKKRK